MKTYFVRRQDNSKYEGMFSREEILCKLETGLLKPEWMVAQNPKGLSYDDFLKSEQGNWKSLANFCTTPEAESVAGVAPQSQVRNLADPDSHSQSEVLETLKAIYAELHGQSKYLQNIYQIQLILFALGLIAFVVGFAIGTGAIRIRP